jgi:hypothetical protein
MGFRTERSETENRVVGLPISLAYLASGTAVSPWLYYLFADFKLQPLRSLTENSADLLGLMILH